VVDMNFVFELWRVLQLNVTTKTRLDQSKLKGEYESVVGKMGMKALSGDACKNKVECGGW